MSLIKSERREGWPIDPMWPDERLDRMFRDMFRDFFAGSVFSNPFLEARSIAPRLEEFVEDGTCVIRAELPDVDPDKDVEITVGDGVLRLRAHREERSEEKRRDGYRSEFYYGDLERRIRLPEGVSDSEITATYKDGMLEIRVPMPPPETPTEPEATKITVTHD